jgi:hypothetical protein
VAVAGGFLYLFLRSAQSVRSEPYLIEQQYLAPVTLTLQTPVTSTSPMLVLQPPQQFGSRLFNQVFSRMMESMKGSAADGVPVILGGEYERALAGRYTPQELLEAAQAAGLDSTDFTPVCVAVRRVSEPGLAQQAYFVIFEWPALVEFREQVAREIETLPTAGAFDAASLSPVMIIAATDVDFDRWLPISARAVSDCIAPIGVLTGS